MRSLTTQQLIEFCGEQSIPLTPDRTPLWPVHGFHMLRCDQPKLDQLTWFCRIIDSFLEPRENCVLWVVKWGQWVNSENWHLYYRLRESYSDLKLLEEAPGHLFLQYEKPDLVSFLEVGILSGWKMHLMPTIGYGRAFVSEECVEFAMEESTQIESLRAALIKAGLIRSP